mmetsp:Transcript_10600/g.18987  ORF Transcript_10600/g.18987 Transcript_10600/m.18987 type:complete len:234 (-) Transcript_10600:606-1307(-)
MMVHSTQHFHSEPFWGQLARGYTIITSTACLTGFHAIAVTDSDGLRIIVSPFILPLRFATPSFSSSFLLLILLFRHGRIVPHDTLSGVDPDRRLFIAAASIRSARAVATRDESCFGLDGLSRRRGRSWAEFLDVTLISRADTTDAFRDITLEVYDTVEGDNHIVGILIDQAQLPYTSSQRSCIRTSLACRKRVHKGGLEEPHGIFTESIPKACTFQFFRRHVNEASDAFTNKS